MGNSPDKARTGDSARIMNIVFIFVCGEVATYMANVIYPILLPVASGGNHGSVIPFPRRFTLCSFPQLMAGYDEPDCPATAAGIIRVLHRVKAVQIVV